MRIRAALAIAALTSGCGDDTSAGGAGAGAAPQGGNGAGQTDGGSGGEGGVGASVSTGGAGGEGGTSAPTRAFVYVGTGAGNIEIHLLDRETGALSSVGQTIIGDNPSFVAAAPDHLHLYVVDEGQDEVVALAIDPDTGLLSELGRKSSEGSGPAYVSVDRSGDWVLVANYGGGTVAVLPILADGNLGDAVDVESPGDNPHLIRTDPSNGYAFVPCLGSDIVARFAFDDATGQLSPLLPDAALPAGTGPRHLEFHPTLAKVYVIGEMGDDLTTFTLGGDGSLTLGSTESTLPVGVDGSDNYCADLHAHPAGQYLYGSNRGHDSIAVFALDGAGVPTPAGHTPTDGSWPRNFAIDPEGGTLLVANQMSDEIVTFAIDDATGELSSLVTTTTGSSPAWVGVVTQPDRR